jgi:hypothetical protein
VVVKHLVVRSASDGTRCPSRCLGMRGNERRMSRRGLKQ